MQPALRGPVPFSSAPSRLLLRFLKSQSESVFLSPEHGAPAFTTLISRRCWSQSAGATTKRHAVRLSESSCCTAAPLQPSCLGVRSLRRRNPNKNVVNAGKRTLSTTAAARKEDEPTGSNPNIPNHAAAGWQERLWGSSNRKGLLKPDDLPSGSECGDGGTFLSGRRFSSKTSIDPRLRCTVVDEQGTVITVDGEFKKTELIARVRKLCLEHTCFPPLTRDMAVRTVTTRFAKD